MNARQANTRQVNARKAAAEARVRLAAAGIEDAAFDAEYLVRVAAGLTRASYLLNPSLTEAQVNCLQDAVARRERREPAPYITGTREFWGLDIAVGPAVLVPRPETELLVELALAEAAALPNTPVVVDVGTGSGCVAIAVALELGDRALVMATDVSRNALEVAVANAQRLGAPVHLVRGDLLSAVQSADIILANLPYIPSFEIDLLEPEVSQWEPRIALDGGSDGFDLIRRLVADCATRLRPRLVALEVGFGMAATAREIAESLGATVSISKDLAGIERIVSCRWT